MDIEGLGERQVRRFLEAGVIDDVAGIYDLTADRLETLEGFARVSAENLIDAIELSKGRSFGNVLFALGLPGIGSVNAETLADHFGGIERLIAAPTDEIEAVDGIGPILAAQIEEALADERTLNMISRLRDQGLQFEQEAAGRVAGGPLNGMTVVLTGTLPSLSRGEATAVIKAAGGKVTNSISRKTRYLIAGESPGTKLAKAQELSIEVLNEEGLLALLDPAAQAEAQSR